VLNIKNWLFLIFVFLPNGKSEVSIPRDVLAVYMMGAGGAAWGGGGRLFFLVLKFTPLGFFGFWGSKRHSLGLFF